MAPHSPSVYQLGRLDHTGNGYHDRDRDGSGSFTHGDCNCTRDGRNNPCGSAPCSGNQRGPPSCLTRPDRNRRPFLPNVQCAACKRVGHIAKHCDTFASAICLEQYMKHVLLATACDSVEKDWLECWKDWLGNPDITPCQVMGTYVKALDITIACLNDQDHSLSFLPGEGMVTWFHPVWDRKYQKKILPSTNLTVL